MGQPLTLSLRKQLGPSPDYPQDPNSEKPFVLQVHARGKSLHLDLRIALDGDYAEGWTISAANEEAVKVPIVTLAQLEETALSQETWKFDLNTGLVFPREVHTTIRGKKRTIIRPGSLFAERKAQLIPVDWLDVEGRTPMPPGFWKTVLEFWEDFPPSVREELEKAGYDPDWAKAQEEKGSEGEVPVGATRFFPGVFYVLDRGTLTLGARRPWFFEYFPEKAKILPERIAFRLVTRTSDIRKALAIEREGALVLPPGEAEETVREPGYWIYTTPEPRPYILSEEAEEKGYVPPKGVAALPQKIQRALPKEARFWEVSNQKEALARARSWFQEVSSELLGKAERTGRFRLFLQTFRGPVVIRWGPSTSLYWFIISEPDFVFSLDNSPLVRDTVAGWVMEAVYKKLWDEPPEFEPKPGTLFNPTKKTPSKVRLLDEGRYAILEEGPGFLKISLEGKELSGVFAIKWEDPAGPIIEISRVRTPEASKTASGPEEKGRELRPIWKSDEKQIVYGIVLSPYGEDAHGHVISPEVIEEAAHRYLKEGREIGLFHFGEPIEACPVESFIAPVDFQYDPENPASLVRKGEWVLAAHIIRKEDWELFKSGEVTGWSIKGFGVLFPES